MSDTVAVYVRVSSVHQEEDGTSLDTQIERCRIYAEEKGWLVRDDLIFGEVASGASYRDRPILSRMRELVRSNEVDVVLCYALDRLARNQDHIAVLVDEMDHAGVRLALVTEDFDNSAIGRQIRNTLAFAAEIEREKLIERTTRGRRERVLRGKLFPGGKPIYGYQWPNEYDDRGRRERGRFVIDPATAHIVQRIFRDFVGGTTLHKLQIALTDEGVPTPTGRNTAWSTSSIARILHNRAYTGEAWGWINKKGVNSTAHPIDEGAAIRLPDGTIPQLVDVHDWELAQALLTRNKERAVRSAKNPEGALLRGGYVRCGYCLGPMYPRPRSNGTLEYVCKRGHEFPGLCLRPSVVSHKVDADAWARVCTVLTNPAVIRAEVEKQRRRAQNPAADDLIAVDRVLAQIAKQQTATARAVSMMDDPEALGPLLARLEQLGTQQRSLTTEREHLLAQVEIWDEQQAELTSLEQWCVNVSANLHQLTFQQKRLVLDVLGVTVTVYKASHDPRWEVDAKIPVAVDSPTT